MTPKANQIVRVIALACNGFREHEHPASPVISWGLGRKKRSASCVVEYVETKDWEFDVKKFRFEGIENGTANNKI
jgi:hypothetical protein